MQQKDRIKSASEILTGMKSKNINIDYDLYSRIMKLIYNNENKNFNSNTNLITNKNSNYNNNENEKNKENKKKFVNKNNHFGSNYKSLYDN